MSPARLPNFELKEAMFCLRSTPVLVFSLAVCVTLIPSAALRADDSGAGLYKAKCAACHGGDGSGTTTVGKSLKVRDLRSPDVQKLSDTELTKVIADGKGKMPAYAAKLSAAQIESLVAAIRATAAK
jgi:mono/diheme cytochrome c family protein